MILADLDRELAALVDQRIAAGTLPSQAARIVPGRTWRPGPAQQPGPGFATSIGFELAALVGRDPAQIAADLAKPLTDLPFVAAAEPTGAGYLTITVTPRALACTALRIAAAGPAAAGSTILAGTTTTVRPWPDPSAAPSWQCAWREHAGVMTGRLAEAAGASATDITTTTRGERRTPGPDASPRGQPTVADAVAWFGVDPVRYALARATPGQAPHLGATLRPGIWGPDPLAGVRQAHASASSTLRWARDLQLTTAEPGERTGDLLCSPAEQALLGLLPWLPVRVAAAAARRRPDELPAYLEAVSAAWLAAWQTAPALPFGGRAAATSPDVRGARLMLASAVQAVLAAGLALTGAATRD